MHIFNPANDLTIWGDGPGHFGASAVTSAFMQTLHYRAGINVPHATAENTADWQGFIPNEITTEKSYGNVLLRNDLWSHEKYWREFQGDHQPIRLAYFGCYNHLARRYWGEWLPENADAVVAPDMSWRNMLLEKLAPGLDLPVFVLPLAFAPPPWPVLPKPMESKSTFTLGSYSAFTPASQLDLLLEGFAKAFANHPDVRLNLAGPDADNGKTLQQLQQIIERQQLRNVHIAVVNYNIPHLYNWLQNQDYIVQLHASGGFSVVPHMTLALGKPILLGQHPFWYHWQSTGMAQSVNGEFMQPVADPFETYAYLVHRPYIYDLATRLQEAFTHRELLYTPPLQQARQFAVAPQHAGLLRYHYHQLVKPEKIEIGAENALHADRLITTSPKLAELYERHTNRAQRKQLMISVKKPYRRRIVTAHDAGFFSIFNIYLSYLTSLDQYRDIQHVLPDWRVNRITEAWDNPRIGSFCYGRPEDGNCWLNLFQPPYEDITAEEMQDGELLFRGADTDCTGYNRKRDLWCTDVYVTNLYLSPEFPYWRRRMHEKMRRHIHMKPHILPPAEKFYTENMQGKYVIGVQIRHPSHGMEQTDRRKLDPEELLQKVLEQVIILHENSQIGDNWRVFLATDQDRIVKQYRELFGNHLLTTDDAARTTVEQDAQYEMLPDGNIGIFAEGFQAHHRAARNRDVWGSHMAEGVIRDAWLLSRCQIFFHKVSNIATAVSYFNPDLPMVFCL